MVDLTILLIITTIGLIFLGYLLMCRLDHFLDSGGILDGPVGRANKGVLVYGAQNVAEKLQKSGIECKILTTAIFPEDGFYSALFALSGDDSSNLELCHAAKYIDPGITIIVRCNAPNLRDVFEAIGADKLLSANEPIDALLAEMRGIER